MSELGELLGSGPAAIDGGLASELEARGHDLTGTLWSARLLADDPAAIEAAGRRHADGYAFTFGAMGTASKNFYNDAFARLGFADEVAEVERLWRAGRRDEAAAAVPLELGSRTNLVGTTTATCS